jgi:Extensin-like protein C-terminus
MVRGVRWYLVGSLVLVLLAGCARSFIEEREPWRHEAEAACLKSGTVKEGPAVTILKPIQGPGACGADFPLRVSALGAPDGPALSYSGEAIRPPGAIPNNPLADPAVPRPVISAPPPAGAEEAYPQAPYATYPQPAAAPYPQTAPYTTYPQRPYSSQPLAPPPDIYPPDPTWRRSPQAAQPNAPLSLSPPGLAPPRRDSESYPPAPPSYDRRPYDPGRPYEGGTLGTPSAVPLGPPRAPLTTASVAAVSPAATLACPLVSALDQWVSGAVQPAAQKWFREPVVEIRQISAYSCRGMNGNPHARISEHAFGNALDIAAFTLADGRKVTVKDGWHGAPEEQGFLRDIEASACQMFSTVLAPGSNHYHYDHIHVDLMRRASGRPICEPAAMSGDVAAARARGRYVNRPQFITGSVEPHRMGKSVMEPARIDPAELDDDHPHPIFARD